MKAGFSTNEQMRLLKRHMAEELKWARGTLARTVSWRDAVCRRPAPNISTTGPPADHTSIYDQQAKISSVWRLPQYTA
jgi:hypothetical protein